MNDYKLFAYAEAEVPLLTGAPSHARILGAVVE